MAGYLIKLSSFNTTKFLFTNYHKIISTTLTLCRRFDFSFDMEATLRLSTLGQDSYGGSGFSLVAAGVLAEVVVGAGTC